MNTQERATFAKQFLVQAAWAAAFTSSNLVPEKLERPPDQVGLRRGWGWCVLGLLLIT